MVEDPSPTVIEKLAHAIRCMEHTLTNNGLCEILLQKGAIEVLLSIYDLDIPVTPGGLSCYHAIMSSMRSFTSQKPDCAVKPLADALRSRLEKAREQFKVTSLPRSSVPSLPLPPSLHSTTIREHL